MHVKYTHNLHAKRKGDLHMDLLNEASEARKKTVNLSIRKGLINEAKELNLNLSKHAEEGIRLAVNKVREQ